MSSSYIDKIKAMKFLMWGGGHTMETDPTKKGWIAKRLKEGSDILLVGRRGVEGCFSVDLWDSGQIDVAVYLDTPEYVAANAKMGRNTDAWFFQMDMYPGWALACIRILEQEHGL